MTLALHPSTLGTVEAKVTASSARLTVQLSANTAEAENALRAALPQLQANLSSTAQQAFISLNGPGQGYTGANGGTQQRPQGQPNATSDTPPASAQSPSATTTQASRRSSLLDIRV